MPEKGVRLLHKSCLKIFKLLLQSFLFGRNIKIKGVTVKKHTILGAFSIFLFLKVVKKSGFFLGPSTFISEILSKIVT